MQQVYYNISLSLSLIRLCYNNIMIFISIHLANEDYIGHSMAVPVTFQTSALLSPEMRGRACMSLLLIDDDVMEENETLRVQIEPDYNDKAVKIADQSSAIVTIIDDDTRKLQPALTPKLYGWLYTFAWFI